MKSLTAIMIMLCVASHSQELGLPFGGVSFLGDLGGNKGIGKTFLKDFQPGEIHPAYGLYYARRIEDYSFGMQFLHGALSGADSLTKGHGGAEEYRRARGLYFSSPLNELTVFAKRYFSVVHFVVGCGAMAFHPAPIYTEKKYSLIQPVILYGGGLTIPFTDNVSIQFEAQGRILFTDYIDDVSARGHPNKDSYVLGLLSLVYTFKTDYLGCPKNIY